MIRYSIRFSAGVLLLATVASQFDVRPASAHSDVFLADVGGQVTIGGANELDTIDENYELTTKVFHGVMIPNVPPFDPHDYGRDEPGFFALPSGNPAIPVGASALPAGVAVTIHLPAFTVGSHSDSLFYWDGVGTVNFQPISTTQPGFAMSLDFNPIDTTAAGGFLHHHAVFQLDNGGPGVPADGVYLISPTVSVAGLADSKPFFMMWVADALIGDEDTAEDLEGALETDSPIVGGKNFQFFNDAVKYVKQNLAVPEPSTSLLSALGLGALVAHSARRRARFKEEMP